ncbi:AAA family ATPase [Nostoc sp.]|uniref:AAA family ATPase n=1 Tax=Nostoc sp. TaxID=1180 RepID=UPI002FFC1046
MGAEEALEFVDNLVFLKTGEHLDKTQRIILRHLWEDEKRTYQDIANSRGYTEAHLKAVGAELWHLLSKVIGVKVSKSTFQGVVQGFKTTQQSQQISQIPNLAGYDAKPQDLDSNFVGRDRQIADLHALVSRGAKVILIQGEGGVGKTTLARKYFKTQKFNFVLELWMATEIQNLTPVESVVEEWLRRYFNEEPGCDFGISLERLRRKLREQASKIGVFIDNLETALDKNGKILESRRPYVELLRLLADQDVHSVTLVTSRERLRESSVEVHLYPLEGLDDQAWRQFFSRRQINCDSTILSEMCKACGGNAKAMQILRGAILTDFSGDIHAYWRNLKKSFELCQRAIFNSEQNNFTQIKAKAISCMAELFREEGEFTRAIFHHSEAIEILDKIGAKSDLAEAYYQLALTHKKMGEIEQSRESFVQAIALFHEMQAPRQVEKVKTAMECFEK